MKITRDYFLWQASSLDSEYRGSIVEDHKGDTGINREIIVQKWLQKHIPRAVTPEIGGKIVDENGNISNQIDIIIYDNDLPRFGAIEKSYYFSEGVSTAIAVKSKLRSGELKDAIQNLATVKQCKISTPRGLSFGKKNQIPTGIFAFENGFSSIQNLIIALNKHAKNSLPPVDFVYINGVIYIAYNRGSWSTTAKDGSKKPQPPGYIYAEKSKSCAWRLILGLSTDSTIVINKTYDFQKYFT